MTTPAARMCDLMKATRRQWLTRAELIAELALDRQTVFRWINELVTQGFLVERPGQETGQRGTPPALFTLSRHWGGQADV